MSSGCWMEAGVQCGGHAPKQGFVSCDQMDQLGVEIKRGSQPTARFRAHCGIRIDKLLPSEPLFLCAWEPSFQPPCRTVVKLAVGPVAKENVYSVALGTPSCLSP